MTFTVEIPNSFLKRQPQGVSPMLSPGAMNTDNEEWLSREFQDEVCEWFELHRITVSVHFDPLRVEFLDVDSALKFKLVMSQWDHLPKHTRYDPVLISLIKRNMPNITHQIAQDIIGVQPMSGPVSDIFALRARYEDPTDDKN